MDLVNKTSNIRLRKINIGTWGSPVAERYGIKSLPALWLVDPDGRVSKSKAKILELLQRGASAGRL